MPAKPWFDHEIHLRHLPVEDAMYRLEKYLDDAFVKEADQIRIVHGKGSGALAEAVWLFLDGHPLVKSFRFAGHGDGDHGVTVTEMESRRK